MTASQEEIGFVEWAFNEFTERTVKRILDVACGTGRFTIPLAEKGFQMTGVDTSNEMLQIAGRKGKERGVEVEFERKDMRELGKVGKFDACICMYGSFNYLLTEKDIEDALKGFFDCLTRGGTLILDALNILNLVGRFKETVTYHYEKDGTSVQLTVKSRIDDVHGIFYQDEFATVMEGGKISAFHEIHKRRVSTCIEMKRFLETAGFSKVRVFGGFEERKEAKDRAPILILVATKDTAKSG